MYKVIILLLLGVGVGLAGPRAELLWGIPGSSPVGRPRCLPRSLDEDSLHVYDCVGLAADLHFSLASRNITGTAEVRATTTEPLPRVDLQFSQAYTLDSVVDRGGEHTVTYTRFGVDSLQIDLTPPLAAGDTISLAIAYHGTPPNIDDWGGFRFAAASGWRPAIGFSMGDGLETSPPPANYNWLPSFADPTDKVSWECWLSADFGTVATSNGLLVDTLVMPDSTIRWHYSQPEPISTYLIFVSISDYVLHVQRESAPWIVNFVYPSRAAQAEVHFANVPAVLDGFVERFGPYPFSRFGYNMTRLGDMEHATCVSHVDQVVGANHTYDWLLFHELSHMWWGNWVTCGDWRDLWLNEGFATFCEALGMEVLGGRAAYQDYVVSSIYPDARGATDSYSIYDPDHYWGATVYQKGAAVMHMLRELLGDSAFFDALREFGQEHAYGNAVTADWQAKLEEHYGSSLSWFFDQWVYGTRYPQFHVTVYDTDTPLITVQQVQPTETLFRMPLEFVLAHVGWDTVRYTFWTEPNRYEQQLDLHQLQFLPTSVGVDPDNKVLKSLEIEWLSADDLPTPVPAAFGIRSISPNPFNASTAIRFTLPAPASVELRVFDVTGRRVDTLPGGRLSAGAHHLDWNGAARASGVYFFELSTPAQSVLAKAVLLK